ncbi:MAG: hypothetical protein A2032_07270 [Chloroflexi bacterium RBG_19FT_COMBO_49_13]|nr:MAG: hypothetical protein A2032_07270 [Chloroflexi bacterium RBG_19FT_COMBO_49_13]
MFQKPHQVIDYTLYSREERVAQIGLVHAGNQPCLLTDLGDYSLIKHPGLFLCRFGDPARKIY